MNFLNRLFLAALLIFAGSAHAVTAASCSRTDVQAALTSTAVGGTVNVPAGTCTWNGLVNITKPVTLIGAGSGAGGTKIVSDGGQHGLLAINVAAQTGRVDVSGFWFQEGNDNYWDGQAINWEGPVGWKNLRIHHNRFDANHRWSLRGPAYVHGLIDNNLFTGVGYGVIFRGRGNADWTTPTLELGTADFFFVEDNTFEWTDFYGQTGVPSADMENGGRIVFRNNFVRYGFMETHDRARNGLPSAHAWEIYNNQFVRTNGSNQWKGLDMSAGTGVIWGNTFTGDYTHPIGGIDYKTVDPRGIGYCDGTDSDDQNVPGEAGWRCQYQLGTHNYGANAISYPIYIWSNTKNSSTTTMVVTGGANHVKSGRDFITNGTTPKPGYTPYTYPHPLQTDGVVPTFVTWYVRPDGGTAIQCTGTTDAAYPGTGSNRACAFKHPSWALGVNDGSATKMVSGDTLIIANGSYGIGIDGPGMDTTGCSTSFSYGCYMRPVPAGTSGFPTKILGAGYASGCTSRPELWGTQRSTVLNLIGSDYVEVQCLDITDHSPCIENHYDNAIKCNRDTYPYGQWASIGILSYDADYVTLKDLDIHGLANTGINAGHLSNWTVDRVRLSANGSAGWNGDVAGIPTSSNSGTMNFSNIEVSWNGCTENYPSTTIIGCWGQLSGGYGDGFGLASSGGDWTFDRAAVHHNTSDGLDLLYLTSNATSTFKRVRAYSNGGNQLKASGTVLIENSVVEGYCQYFFGKYGSAMGEGDSCRANGNAISLNLPNISGTRATVRYSTITGTGDCLLLFTGAATSTANINIENNILFGQVDWYANRTGSPGELSCLSYSDVTTATVNFRSNVIWNVKGSTCPATSTCSNPNVSNSTAARFDGKLLSTSPARNSGNTTYTTPATDIRGTARPQETNPTRGAFEYTP